MIRAQKLEKLLFGISAALSVLSLMLPYNYGGDAAALVIVLAAAGCLVFCGIVAIIRHIMEVWKP